MAWLTDRHLFAIAVTIYGLSAFYSIFLFRKGFRKDDRINYLLLLTGFLFHTGAMLQRGFSLDRCPIRNLFEATLFVAWTMVGVYLVAGLWPRLRFLGAFAAPLLAAIGVFGLMPDLDRPGTTLQLDTGNWLSVHVALFSIAYGAFGLSAVAGLMYLTQERDLKMHRLRAVLSKMPSIQRLELTSGWLLLAGFGILTLALGVSFAGFKHFKGQFFTGDPKIIWSIFVWVLYLVLVVMRWKFAQGGRRFAWGAIGGFTFVLLTFWGASFWSPLHNPTP